MQDQRQSHGQGTVVKVSIVVGDRQTPYAEIVETYSPFVSWPGPVVIIDNYDSFTYNLYQQIAGLGHAVEVFKHDAVSTDQLKRLQPSHIVISPGPGRPADSGISREVIRQFYETVPLLGVCLGHQALGEVFGSHTVAAPTIMHGKTDLIRHDGTGLFADLPNPFVAARYHSLVLDRVPVGFVKTAWSGSDANVTSDSDDSGDGSIMAIRHEKLPVYGLQFHPESFLTEYGTAIMEHFLAC
jgi:anthranilate synthase/aminodeoxychorismate synthase-like glutamine amidotransferase